VFFLTDARKHKEGEITRYSKVCLAFAVTGNQEYVSLSGPAQILNDQSKIRDLGERRQRRGGILRTILTSTCSR
jgi:general stress protein 26